MPLKADPLVVVSQALYGWRVQSVHCFVLIHSWECVRLHFYQGSMHHS
jgi:hypothetical protein